MPRSYAVSSSLSLHDALPISSGGQGGQANALVGYDGRTVNERDDRGLSGRRKPRYTTQRSAAAAGSALSRVTRLSTRSEEHTSELQSRFDLVCRLLCEKKR